ncbi:PREDICTED: piwi-like protein 1 isoform X2 [Amphimedon queenslandica]|uniref:Uncharacterized protein n=1 Tax=Amphimedon queenslandica TaxID=400682 RepID=A0A1X7VQA2_AMPQE|nr:PREDICTED: piwi-like protein 1 isoform X2 [Amphimedon queenslandica]|eukprot:XP_019856843.1 PREDICTED: piwi-like protein 1 isoform X2 [Amphimedon queenslandica]
MEDRPLPKTGRGAALAKVLEQSAGRTPGGVQSAAGRAPGGVQYGSPIAMAAPLPMGGRGQSMTPPPHVITGTARGQGIQSLGRGHTLSTYGRGQPQTAPTNQNPAPPTNQSKAGPLAPDPIPVPKPIGRGMLLRKLYESQTKTQSLIPKQSPPSGAPPSDQLSQLQLQGAVSPPSKTPPTSSPRSPSSPASQATLKANQHSPPGPAHSPQTNLPVTSAGSPQFTLLSDGEIRQGISGQRIPLGANYLVVKSRSNTVFQYMVSFNPPVESKNMRYGMINEHKDLIGPTRAFDGSVLYLPLKITDDIVTRKSIRSTDGTEITIDITLTNVLEYRECTQLFNIIIRRVLRAIDMQEVGRHYFDKNHPIKIPQHKMELWPGYVTSIHHFDAEHLLLLLDVSHKMLRMDTALDFLYELYSSCKDGFQEEATRQLVGSIVLTRYNNKTYRVDDIAWDKNPQSTFIDHNGRPMSFIEYYRNTYGRDITDKEQPLLVHRPKKNRMHFKRGRGLPETDTAEEVEQVICLVPELCSMTGLTDKARSDFRVMKDLAAHTRITPAQREIAIKKFVRTVNESEKAKEELSSWGLSLHPNILETNGRLYKPETVLFRDGSVVAGLDADWSRQLVKEHVISAVPLTHWLLLVTKRDSGKAVDFIEMMKKVCPPMGIEVKEPRVIELQTDKTELYLRAIRENMSSSLQLVVAIFPTQRDDRYSSLKKLCCVECPIPSQVINARTISQQQKLRSVTQKVALQINVKLGGELWAVKTPLENAMVIGIDVYHDSTRGKRSVLGFVSSTNKFFTRWYSRVTIQGANQEIGDGLKICFQSSLRKYYEINHNLPDRIVIFRDGVGDGQVKTVVEFEIPQMKSCLAMFGESYKPKIGFVIVQKRIATRLFSHGPQGYENPCPGTVLDHTVTRKGWYDYFLVSQHVRQGTVTPTHYHVVLDNAGLKPDHMQKLTYKLTHMYYNWPGTIRVPAPCQYAHKLAFLVGQSLHREPSLEISDRLFFL